MPSTNPPADKTHRPHVQPSSNPATTTVGRGQSKVPSTQPAPRPSAEPTLASVRPVNDPYFTPAYTTSQSRDGGVRASAARDRSRRRRGRRGGDWAWVVIAGTLMSVVLVFSVCIALILRVTQGDVAIMTTDSAALPTAVLAQSTFGSTNGDLQAGQQITLDDGRSIVLSPWTGGARLTVLIMGLDRRPNEEGLMYRTDTMMLISLDRDTGSLGILSIPRDLYVDIPGYADLQRINTAMVLGELQQPNYGPTLAMQTVQYNLGMYVHGYVAVDFEAVETIIDLLGGVDIDVPYPIADYEYPDMNFGYDPLILQAGLQHMDGATALKFARTRHGDNDFERSRRQQLVLYAVRDRILDFNLLPQLIIQSPTLLSSLSENVYTNLTADQLIQVALTLKDVTESSIRTGVIDDNYSMPYTTQSGAQVLVPRRSMLADLLTATFGADYSE